MTQSMVIQSVTSEQGTALWICTWTLISQSWGFCCYSNIFGDSTLSLFQLVTKICAKLNGIQAMIMVSDKMCDVHEDSLVPVMQPCIALIWFKTATHPVRHVHVACILAMIATCPTSASLLRITQQNRLISLLALLVIEDVQQKKRG